METTELEAKVYKALTEDEELMGMLPTAGEVPIFHLIAPAGDGQQYPILVYAPISDVPCDFGDNDEIFHRVTIRINIITTDGQYDILNRVVRRIMKGLEFKRIQTVPTADWEYDKIVLSSDYQIMIES